MTKPELMKKLDALFDQLERDKVFGSIEIEVRCGCASVLRVTKTERLEDRGTPHANNYKDR